MFDEKQNIHHGERMNKKKITKSKIRDLLYAAHCTEVRFANLLSGGFTTMAVINPPERKLESAHLCSVLRLDATVLKKIFITKVFRF